MLRQVTLFGLLVLIGCGRASPTAEQAPPAAPTPEGGKVKPGPSPQPPPRPTPTEPRPEVVAFREKVAVYLVEARAGAKLLTLAPSLEQAKSKAAQITDLYTRIPDTPREIDKSGEVAKKLKNINGSFAVAEVTVGLRQNFVRLKSLEGIKKADSNLADIAKELNDLANEIEARVGR